MPRSTVTHHVNWIYSGTRYESNSSMEIAAMSLTTRMTRSDVPFRDHVAREFELGTWVLGLPFAGVDNIHPCMLSTPARRAPRPQQVLKGPISHILLPLRNIEDNILQSLCAGPIPYCPFQAQREASEQSRAPRRQISRDSNTLCSPSDSHLRILGRGPSHDISIRP